VQGYLTSGRPAVCVETFAALSTEEAITRFEKAGIGTARVSIDRLMPRLWSIVDRNEVGRLLWLWRATFPSGRLPKARDVEVLGAERVGFLFCRENH
jgi:hypothetical protein